MRLSTARAAWARWQACAGAWQGWSVCPTLLSPEIQDIVELHVEQPTAHELACQLASSLQHDGVLVVLDLDPVVGVHIAALLNEWRVANGVLLLPRWPYRHAILPVDGLVGALVEQASRLVDEAHLPNVTFVLDAERAVALRARPASDQRADNRYRLGTLDLPNLAALRAHGIRHVRKVCMA